MVVASELLGAGGVGGAGTADSLLAVALGRAGHEVSLLFARAEHVGTLSPEWERIYAAAGVNVEQLVARAQVDPHYFTPTVDVFHTLRADPPEIVIANDWRGLTLASLRAREVGRAFSDTAFVLLCHGPSTVLVEFSQKVPDTVERFAMDVAERTCIGLADAVVSPSAWLLEWMRGRRWPVPESATVVQYLSQATALGEPSPQAPTGVPVRRLAFFGQMREGKGVRVLLESLALLEPGLLEGVELLFLGRVTRRWTPESVTAFLDDRTKDCLGSIRFETALDRAGALAELRTPGTLALMPSLLDNSPNTVSECVEQGIPLIASTAGGIPELVADEDRSRVLVEARPEALADALRLALTSSEGFPPARPARDPQAALDSWLELVDSVAPSRRRRPPPAAETPAVSVVAVGGTSAAGTARRLASATAAASVDVVPASSRADGLSVASGEWVLFLDETHVPDDGLLDALVGAQAASGADVVTCAVRMGSGGNGLRTRLFLGDAGSLGLIENHYGVLALIRRSLLDASAIPAEGKPDPTWPLLAHLVLSGARVASVPDPLGGFTGTPGTIRDVPGYGLAVLSRFESGRVPPPDLPLLAATLGAAILTAPSASAPPKSTSWLRLAARSRDVLRAEGIGGLAHRAAERVRRIRAGAA
ncbi:MAG TPA: glycosyltransferase [Gaiellaceae bacterium]|nr:glycosyltransferase [Gaiellaceae bacterium]